MRNWFILFTTIFTITTLTLTITTHFVSYLPDFNNQYILLLAISSSIISLFIVLSSKLSIENVFVSIFIDISIIFLTVYLSAIMIDFVPINIINSIIILSLVILTYIIISFIYLFVLRREAEEMNEKISHWRGNYAQSRELK